MWHLPDEIAWIHSQLIAGLMVGPEERLREESCPAIWEWLEPVGPEEGLHFIHLLFRSLLLLSG